MQAVILAAGESSRLYPYNSLGHKSLITLLGKTLIERTVESVIESGIKDIVIVEDKKKSISNKLGKKYRRVSLKFVQQKEPKGMGDALLSAEKLLKSTFFVTGAYHFEFHKFAGDFKKAKKKKEDIVILTKEGGDFSQFGAIRKVNGKVKVEEKSENSGAVERIVGIYLLNKNYVKTLKKVKRRHYDFEDAISEYSEKNDIVIVKTKQKTLSLKYPWDLIEIKDYLLERVKSYTSSSAQVSEKAIIRGDGVVIEKNAKIMDGAVISGPCYIGRGAYVGTNAVVRNRVAIEESSIIGSQMEIKNSILMKMAKTHSGFIGDSIIGEETKIAASFNTGNVRLDRNEIEVTVKVERINTHRKYLGVFIGSNSSFGIKVGTMPGVIIGNNVIVGPGTTIMENIPDNTTYYAEFKKNVQKKHE